VTAANPVVMFSFTNPNSIAMTYTFSVSETTMFSRWESSVFEWISVGDLASQDMAGKSLLHRYTTHSVFNTSNARIAGTLTLFNRDGTVKDRVEFRLPPNGSTGIGNDPDRLPTQDEQGTVTLTHDGPPGAIIGDASIVTLEYISQTPLIVGRAEEGHDLWISKNRSEHSLKFEAPRGR
jgi:hypothetical protein